MIDDLKDNYLKIGMPKNDIITLLGRPYKDILTSILPKGTQLPDSLKVDYDIERSKEEERIHLIKYNKWRSDNGIVVPMLKYPIGWSLIDPIFLEIRLNEEDKLVDFWVAQH